MIETERLLLRPFSMDDLELIMSLYCDAEILRYTPFDTKSPLEAAEHLAKVVADWNRKPLQSLEFAMIRKTESTRPDEKIGRCHILIDPETDTGMIGWLLRKEYQGQNYARESGEALIQYCFDTLMLHRVNAVCHPDNIASRKVLERCGLRLEAHYRKKCRYVKKGIVSWEDELEYALLAEEHRRQNQKN